MDYSPITVFNHETDNPAIDCGTYAAKWMVGAALTAALLSRLRPSLPITTGLALACTIAPGPLFFANREMSDKVNPPALGLIAGIQLALVGSFFLRLRELQPLSALGLAISALELGWIKGAVVGLGMAQKEEEALNLLPSPVRDRLQAERQAAK